VDINPRQQVGERPTGAEDPDRTLQENCSVSVVSNDNSNLTLIPQSGVEGVSIMKSSVESNSQNVAFSDQFRSDVYEVDSEIDSTRKLQDTNDATLDNFFSRPIKIAEEEWGTGTALAFDVDPWSEYFTNPRVINRIVNYNLLRAKLHVKVLINGNGFQYGRALVSYLPMPTFDTLSSNAALVRQDLVQASQQPHIFLDPTTSTGGEMVLPFFHYDNYLSIPDQQWSEMGRLFFRSINPLKHANGASDKVTVSVFAWAEDVNFNVLTTEEPSSLVPQSGEIEEANNKGVISGPATAVAKIANIASVIPGIEPFAMATSKAATAVAAGAKALGYCAPPVTKAPEPYRPTTTSSLSNVNVPQVVNRLGLDEKQELTIDPRIAGLGSEDPLMIKNIAQRESYLTTFNWDIGTAPETLLWNSRVTPVTWAESGLTPKSFHFPACCMAALPFTYWTGTMKFRFQIVASTFHKGRLKIVYDPNHIASNEYNTNYLRIVDIAKETDFTIEVGNGQNRTLLGHARPGADSVTEIYSSTPYTGNAPGNGTLGVYVVNELTTPNSVANNDIEINVFVSVGDDFEVFVPDSRDFQRFVFKPQSGELQPQSGETSESLVPESLDASEPSAPLQEQSQQIGPTTQDLRDVNKVFTGEEISSFRTMLKRPNLHSTVPLGEALRLFGGIRPIVPYLRGNVAGAVDQRLGPEPYNFCNTVLFHWVAYAFSGWRGSMRWKLLPRMVSPTTQQYQMIVFRNNLGLGISFTDIVSGFAASLNRGQASRKAIISDSAVGLPDFPNDSYSGSLYTNESVNTATEFEVPYYSPVRFTPGKDENITGTDFFNPTWSYRLLTEATDTSVLDFYCSTGEDVQFYFWTGLPRMYFEASPPVSA
jgi:hypothetical protein